MPKPILTVHNFHNAQCGAPPNLTIDNPSVYAGYFVNLLGDQWVFRFDYDTGEGTLWGSDIGWDEPRLVVDGEVQEEIFLSFEEQLWLWASWAAATRTNLWDGLASRLEKYFAARSLGQCQLSKAYCSQCGKSQFARTYEIPGEGFKDLCAVCGGNLVRRGDLSQELNERNRRGAR